MNESAEDEEQVAAPVVEAAVVEPLVKRRRRMVEAAASAVPPEPTEVGKLVLCRVVAVKIECSTGFYPSGHLAEIPEAEAKNLQQTGAVVIL